ncbi:MAG: aspartate/glutamate racemase family protein [Aigarchaeota archaeon]|nr:aspartate/glutamate racemase family protein [Candidatus Geocrenenecus dongiae]
MQILTYTIGLIRVLTIDDEEKLNLHGKIIEKTFPELKVITKCIEDQPEGIYDLKSEELAKHKILKLIKEFQDMNVNAVIISCAGDPAVAEARRIFKIPIIGAGSASASLALAYGERVGVIKITEEVPKIIRKILGPHLIAEERPENVRNVVDLMSEEGRIESINALRRLLKYDVEVIVLACTGFTTIGFKKIAKEITSIPIIDPVIAAGSAAISILKQKNE